MQTFTETIATGSYRDQLVATRDLLADMLVSCHSPRDQAPLAAQLRAVLADLDALPLGSEESTVDDLARQRAARLAAARAS